MGNDSLYEIRNDNVVRAVNFATSNCNSQKAQFSNISPFIKTRRLFLVR